jgi:hypothetical protein
MANQRGVNALATAVLLLAVVPGCSDSADEPPKGATSTPRSPTPTTTNPSPTPTSGSQLAAAAASGVVRHYFATVDRLGRNPAEPLRQLAQVAASVQLSAQRRLIAQQREEGLRQTGDTKVAVLEVEAVNLDNSDPAAGDVPTVAIDVCWDVSDVDIVDESGNSIVSASRPDTGWTRYTVANYRWETSSRNGWRVASGQDLKRTPCAAS